jgi:hypothetical protein
MNRVGLWIDHTQAVIVSVGEQGATVKKIESGVKHVQYRGAPRPRSPYSAQYAQGDDQLDRQFVVHLNKYYGKVIAVLRGAGSILVFGPGEAKSELKKRLGLQRKLGRNILVETSDKMTERQIVAKVRKHFRELDAGS